MLQQLISELNSSNVNRQALRDALQINITSPLYKEESLPNNTTIVQNIVQTSVLPGVTVMLTQEGTSAPQVLSSLKNSYSDIITTRVGIGNYRVKVSGAAFQPETTELRISNNTPTGTPEQGNSEPVLLTICDSETIEDTVVSSGQVEFGVIGLYTFSEGEPSDEILKSHILNIDVYPGAIF